MTMKGSAEHRVAKEQHRGHGRVGWSGAGQGRAGQGRAGRGRQQVSGQGREAQGGRQLVHYRRMAMRIYLRCHSCEVTPGLFSQLMCIVSAPDVGGPECHSLQGFRRNPAGWHICGDGLLRM